jgi:hypothetical protein
MPAKQDADCDELQKFVCTYCTLHCSDRCYVSCFSVKLLCASLRSAVPYAVSAEMHNMTVMILCSVLYEAAHGEAGKIVGLPLLADLT